VLYDPERRWVDRAACRRLTPDDFFADGTFLGHEPTQRAKALWEEAKVVCSHCPVLTECRRDTLGEEYGVWGGLDERERHLIRTALSKRKRWQKWPEAKRLEWGEHLAGLRQCGLSNRAITLRTGFNFSVVDGLIQEWKDSLPQEAPKVVDLQLPETPKAPFPETKGSRHAWVRNGPIVTDGWYAGETADGKWIRMQIYSVRGHVKKFFRPEDVKFYFKQTRWVVKYGRRPDADSVQEDAHAA
jgi:WhiB family redox-sensing transcriptional regulator